MSSSLDSVIVVTESVTDDDETLDVYFFIKHTS